MSRIAHTFARLKAQKRKALIPYVTAGYPLAQTTPALMHAMVQAGADVIELGVPFSDPSSDGPTIQAAGEQALRNGIGLAQVLEHVREFRLGDAVTPVVLMGYANPIERYDQLRSTNAFAHDAAAAGVDGVLVVDYPPEECEAFAAELKAKGLDLIFLLAPTSTPERMEQIARIATGYVYYVSIKGVTGTKTLDAEEVASKLEAIRQHVHIPVGVGFGIRNAQTAQSVAQTADAVVIGSKIIELLTGHDAAQGTAAVTNFLQEIRQSIDA